MVAEAAVNFLMCRIIRITLINPMSRISRIIRIIRITPINPSRARARRHARKKMVERRPHPLVRILRRAP